MRNPFKRRKPGFPITTVCATCGQRLSQHVHIEKTVQIEPSHIFVICHVDDSVDVEAHQLTHMEASR